MGFSRRAEAKPSGEDYFVASRSLSQYVFLLALFGTNMTAFAILGSSGIAYHRGIGIFGLMASSSALVIPLTLFFIGTRLWAIGKKFGHMTQVQFFRDRWECDAIGTVIFALTIVMFVPYIIIGVMGGGQTLEAVSTTIGPNGEPRAFFSYEMGGALVALVIMSYVFVGGMRGTAWVNAFQTLLFLSFGAAAFFMISRNLGGFDEVIAKLAAEPKTAPLLTRQRIPVEEFFSYTLHPALLDHVPAHGDHVLHGGTGHPFQEDRHLLSDLYGPALAAVRLPGRCRGEPVPRASPRRVRRCPPAAA